MLREKLKLKRVHFRILVTLVLILCWLGVVALIGVAISQWMFRALASSSSRSPTNEDSLSNTSVNNLSLLANLVQVLIVYLIPGVALFFLGWWIKEGHDRDRKDSRLRFSEDVEMGEPFVRSTDSEQVPQELEYEEVKAACDGFVSEIGSGHYGKVYQGYFRGQAVAVKMLLGAIDTATIQREVASMRQARHRNVLPLLGSSLKGEFPLLVVPLLDCSLSKKLNEGISWSNRCKVALGVARGLAYLHNQLGGGRIVHCDIKPDNVLLDNNCEPYISDFGLSKLIQGPSGGTISTWRGTKGYAAPELTDGNLDRVSPTLDVFSYGVLLFALITGRADAHNCKIKQMLTEKVVDARLDDKDDPFKELQLERMRKVALACIQTDPQDRPTMYEVMHQLSIR